MAEDDEKKKIVISILNCCAAKGPTDIRTIRRDFKEQYGQELEGSVGEALAFLWRMDEVEACGPNNDTFRAKSKNSEHIAKLVEEQRPPPRKMQRRYSCYVDRDRIDSNDRERHTSSSLHWGRARDRSTTRRSPTRYSPSRRSPSRRSPLRRSPLRTTTNDWLPSGTHNRPARNMNHSFGGRSHVASTSPRRNDSRPQSSYGSYSRDPRLNASCSSNSYNDRENAKIDEPVAQTTANPQRDVQFQKFGIIADDFMFHFMLERAVFTNNGDVGEILNPQWSYTAIGQTIAGAITLISQKHGEQNPSEPIRVLVNIGATDICRGRSMFQVVQDFVRLIETCQAHNLVPTICTVLPFGNAKNGQEIAWKIHTFNGFLKSTYDNVIDLWSSLVIGIGRSLSTQFLANGQVVRFSGRESDISWQAADEQLVLEHRG